jgi:hypothetical protein
MNSSALEEAFQAALRLESRREHAAAAKILDDALASDPGAPAPLRFRALLVRSDLAVELNDLAEGRGILAEARQVRLSPDERGALAAELRRADDLETFFTHRGCAG